MFRIAHGKQPSLTQRVNILVGVKTEAAKVSDRANVFALVPSARRLGAVLDHINVVFISHRHDGVHVTRQTVEMLSLIHI